MPIAFHELVELDRHAFDERFFYLTNNAITLRNQTMALFTV